MAKPRWFRVVSPELVFTVQEADGWYEVLRNGTPMLVNMNGGRVAAARFKNKHVAAHFIQACQLLEKRFQ